MSDYYSGKRSKNLFDPESKTPFKISRSRIELFLQCPRCFYIDRRLGVDRPPGFPFNLNSAVDALLKREFDMHRAKNTRHPLMRAYGIDAVPFQHEKMEEWRDALRRGITYHHKPTNLIIAGGIDDVWVNPKGELHIVDYKATSKREEVTLDADWQISYKWQMEIYQWLFRMNGFKVSKTGYFVYCNGRADKEAFDGKLEFDVKVIPYDGDDSWVETKIVEAHECLKGEIIPQSNEACDFCLYRDSAGKVEKIRE
jgi:CRISPR/Cas system-associated exonuclease Cas4 (RecB family)